MIQHIDEVLRNLIFGELGKGPKPLISDPSQITMRPPSSMDDPKGGARINLYLHDIQENTAARDDTMRAIKRPGDTEAVRRRANVRLKLSYLVTTHVEDDPHAEHRLLTELLGAFMRTPAVPKKYFGEDLVEDETAPIYLQIAQPEHPIHADPSGLWQALGGKLRPTLGLVVSAAFNPFESFTVKLVREAVFGFRQGVPPHQLPGDVDIRGIRVSIAGMVVDNRLNTPLADVKVQAEGYPGTTQTDERGFFFFTDLPASQYTLKLSRPGYADVVATARTAPPGRPELLEPLEVEMEALGDGGFIGQKRSIGDAAAPMTDRRLSMSLYGRLRHPDGRPAPYIPVRIGDKRTLTDGDGVYKFSGLADIRATVIAEFPGIGDVEVFVDGGEPTSNGKVESPKSEKAEKSKKG